MRPHDLRRLLRLREHERPVMVRDVPRQIAPHLRAADVEHRPDHRQDVPGLVVRLQGPELAEGEGLQARHLERARDAVDVAAAHGLAAEHLGGQVAFEADVGGAVVEDVGVVFAPTDVFANGLEVVGGEGGQHG